MHLPRYPVYIVSKGRWEFPLTARFLQEDGVPFFIVVEPQEQAAYAEAIGAAHVLTLPFSNLGLGSIPARNWIWEHSLQAGYKRHWIFDDNIRMMRRRFRRKWLRVSAGVALYAMEEFTERYENIGIAGANYTMFVPDTRRLPPFHLNCHVYSNLLILNSLPYRWRGRYNEDTDLCLQVLAGGLCTVQFNAFMVDKITTMKMKGGNTESLYQGHGRLEMAKSLERAWPYVVSVNRRWGRPQHVVTDAWKKFDTQLKRRADLDWEAISKQDGDFGMQLGQEQEIQSEYLRKWFQNNSSP